jgi:type II secretory pathway component PulJ
MMGAVGWIVSVVLVALMLPLLAFMLLDTLEQKQEVRQQLEKVEKLRREIEKIERKNRDKTPSSITDNPVFDRVRRPLQISMSRPKELG